MGIPKVVCTSTEYPGNHYSRIEVHRYLFRHSSFLWYEVPGHGIARWLRIHGSQTPHPVVSETAIEQKRTITQISPRLKLKPYGVLDHELSLEHQQRSMEPINWNSENFVRRSSPCSQYSYPVPRKVYSFLNSRAFACKGNITPSYTACRKSSSSRLTLR